MSTGTLTPTTPDPCGGFDLDAITLSHGSHGGGYQGECCLVEAANVATTCIPALRERFGAPEVFKDDHPSISRVVRAMAIGLNDLPWASDQARTEALKPYITRILGTATTSEAEQTRAWMAADWLVRVYTPAWLRLAGHTEHAQLLESLARVADATTAVAAQPTLDAAWSAAESAARSAARSAAESAAESAAWSAAWSAARSAAWSALTPTAETLRDSALLLLESMIAVGRSAESVA